MGLTRLAIHRPVTMLMLIGALILMGLISYTQLPVQQLPNVSFPFVVVVVNFPGASPEDMLQTVTEPIENAVSGVAGISTMNGLSADGLSRVAMQFVSGTDVNTAANDVAQAVDRIQGRLPAGIQTPTIIKANPNAFPIMNVAVYGNLRPDQLYNLATNVLQPALQEVGGVAAVNISGGLVPQVNVTVNPDMLSAYGLSLQQIDSAIAAQNVSVPGGSTTVGPVTSTTRTEAYFQTATELQNMVVATRSQGNVTLSQVANVQQGYAPATNEALFDGQTAVGLSITAQSGANQVQVDRAVKATLAHLASQLPQGVQTKIVNDQTTYTYESLRAVEDDLVLAVLLPALVLLLFLHRPRNMLIVMLAIPTSLISTFTLMLAFGFNLDTISLLALSLITGILVDDSIVVLENINRHLSMGKNPIQAAIDGRSEIGLAAIAITMTDVVVYMPIAFTSGIIGMIFREFGLTIVVATLFSLFVSFTLTPLLASRWLQTPMDEELLAGTTARGGLWTRFSAGWERGYESLRGWYGRLIHTALRHRGLVVLIGVGALLLSIAFIPLGWVGTEFVPQEDNSQFNVNITLPIGTSLPTTEQVVNAVDKQIRAMPGVLDTSLTAGGGGGFFGAANTNSGRIAVDLKPVGQRPPITTYLGKVRAIGRKYPGATIFTQVQSSFRAGGQRAVGVVLQGPDINALDTLSNRVQTMMEAIPGVQGVRNQAGQDVPELAVQINRQQAAYFGITATQIGDAVQTAISGSTVSYLRPNGSTNETPIVVTVRGGDSMTPQQLENLPLTTATAAATGGGAAGGGGGSPAGSTSTQTLIRLGQVATVVATNAPAQLQDQNRQLEVTVDASTQGVPQGQVAQDIGAGMAKLGLPPGYSWSFSGAVQQQQQTFGPMFEAFLLSVILVYMLTSALYESLLYPLAVLFSLPLATVGALSGLAVTGNTLNLFSFMGLIMLMGLVAKNAILLVDYANTLRSRGLDRLEAIVESGRTRLRPILMTTCTMVFAMLPLALKIGAASEERSPMATVLISGLITSTALTLVFVPCIYSYLDDFGAWLARHGMTRRTVAATPSPAASLPAVGGGSQD